MRLADIKRERDAKRERTRRRAGDENDEDEDEDEETDDDIDDDSDDDDEGRVYGEDEYEEGAPSRALQGELLSSGEQNDAETAAQAVATLQSAWGPKATNRRLPHVAPVRTASIEIAITEPQIEIEMEPVLPSEQSKPKRWLSSPRQRQQAPSNTSIDQSEVESKSSGRRRLDTDLTLELEEGADTLSPMGRQTSSSFAASPGETTSSQALRRSESCPQWEASPHSSADKGSPFSSTDSTNPGILSPRGRLLLPESLGTMTPRVRIMRAAAKLGNTLGLGKAVPMAATPTVAEELPLHTAWVGNIPSSKADEKSISGAFSRFSVTRITVRKKPYPKPSWAYVTFADSSTIKAAMDASTSLLAHCWAQNLE